MLCKYKWGQKVRFPFRDAMKEGYIEIVDAFGTFEQKEEPSYDIMVYPDDCLYKHVRESMIECTLEETDSGVRGRLVYNEEIQKYGIRYSKDGYQVLMDGVSMIRFAGSSEWISVDSVNLEDCVGYRLEAKIKGIKE